MAGQSDDFLMRQVQGLGEVAAKLVAGALGQEYADVEEMQESQVDGLLRDEFAHTRINLLDLRSAISLLRPAKRALSYGRLLGRKAAIVRAERPDAHDPRLSRRAMLFILEAYVLEGGREADGRNGFDLQRDTPMIEALLGDLDPSSLAPRELELLASLDIAPPDE